MNKNDRKRGSLFGLACGDALGAAVEFSSPGSFPEVTGYRSGGPYNLKAGQWTDDTSMALALATSISKGWNPEDQMREYVEWYETGKYSVNGHCFDIGGTTLKALERYLFTKDISAAPRETSRSGNGCIMRLAPVAIKYSDLYPNNLQKLTRYAEESSSVTHASLQCVSACRFMVVVLAALINGEDREKALNPDLEPLMLEPKILDVAEGSYRNKKHYEVDGSGWVVESLEAALWAFHNSENFEEAVLKAVNLGNDADTTGAVCGQFAGACWGESGIPEHLLKGLARKDMIEDALKGIL